MASSMCYFVLILRGLAQYEGGRMRRMVDGPGSMDMGRPLVPSSGGKPNGLSFEVVLNKLQVRVAVLTQCGTMLTGAERVAKEQRNRRRTGQPLDHDERYSR